MARSTGTSRSDPAWSRKQNFSSDRVETAAPRCPVARRATAGWRQSGSNSPEVLRHPSNGPESSLRSCAPAPAGGAWAHAVLSRTAGYNLSTMNLEQKLEELKKRDRMAA